MLRFTFDKKANLCARSVAITSGLAHLSLFLERIRKITISVRKVGLKFDRPAVGVDGEVDEPLFVINAGQVPVDDGIVRTQVESS